MKNSGRPKECEGKITCAIQVGTTGSRSAPTNKHSGRYYGVKKFSIGELLEPGSRSSPLENFLSP